MKAVLLAGGKGTRLVSVTNDEIPKSMTLLCGKPILEHQIEVLRRYGIIDIIMVVGHLYKKIQDYFGDGHLFGVNITYVLESEPLGTGGGLYYLKAQISEDFILIYGDIIFDVSIPKMIDQHRQTQAIATLFAHPNSHPYDSDLLIVDRSKKVVSSISKKATRPEYYANLVNACIYILSPDFFFNIDYPHKMDLDSELIFPLCGENGRVYSYISPEYVKDVGTPERLRSAEADMLNGLIFAKNLDNKQRCIFLDRDGTINKYVGLLSNVIEFELENGVQDAIALVNSSPYLCIVITNQPVVARNLCTIEQLELVHCKMQTLLGGGGAYLDDILYCPHHPDKGYEGENPAYKVLCNCRKPDTEMIMRCIEKYNIDVANSWFVGDTTIDIKTGENAGLKTILLKTGLAGADQKYTVKPHYILDTLADAIKYILEVK